VLYRGSYISDARGSAGGITASRNRAGAYLRARVSPTNVSTTPRSRARNSLAAMPAAWAALTTAQQGAWNDLASANTVPNKLGDPIKLTGFTMYSRTNVLRLLGGLAQLAAAPTTIPTTTLTPPTSITLTASTGTLAANVTNTDPWAATTGGRLFVFITQGQNPTRQSPTGGFTFWGSVSGNTSTPPATLSLTVPPVSIIATRVYFVRFRAIDSVGRVSADQIVRVVAG